MIPSCGHTIHATHIERAIENFAVEWDSITRPTAVDGVMWEEGKRWCWVKAETPGGALDVAKYHYGGSGTNFRLVLTIDNHPANQK